MTEWTVDLVVPRTTVADTNDTPEEGQAAASSPDVVRREDEVTDPLVDDDRLDLVDWFA